MVCVTEYSSMNVGGYQNMRFLYALKSCIMNTINSGNYKYKEAKFLHVN